MANQLSPDEGLWDYTDETRLLKLLAKLDTELYHAEPSTAEIKTLLDRIS